MSNHDGNPFAGCTAPPPTTATVLTRRRDGKFTVRLYYPISGRGFTKVLTREQIDTLRGYEVRWRV